MKILLALLLVSVLGHSQNTLKKNNYQGGEIQHHTNYQEDRNPSIYEKFKSGFEAMISPHENRTINFQKNGIQEKYHKNGVLKFRGNYIDGQKNGTHIWKYENNMKRHEEHYKMGKLMSEKCWDKSGRLVDCHDIIMVHKTFF